MLVDVEAARSAVMHGAWAVGAGEDDARGHAAIAKAVACAAAVRVADKALFLHGAVGYTWEHDLQFPFKRVKSDALLFGSPDAHLDGSPAPSSRPDARRGMRAVVLRRVRRARGARAVEWPDPAPPPGWVVVELRAAAMNWHDVIVAPRRRTPDGAAADHRRRRRGRPARHRRAGRDPAVAALGRRRAPSRPSASRSSATSPTARTPSSSRCRRRTSSRCPAGFDWPEAAALPLAGVTAYRALFSRGGAAGGRDRRDPRRGQRRLHDRDRAGERWPARACSVTSSSPAKIDRARRARRGRRRPVHRRRAGPSSSSRPTWSSTRSAATWPDSLSVLKPGGRVVAFGATGGDKATLNVRPFYFGQFSLLGTTMGSPRDFAGLLEHARRPARGGPRSRPCCRSTTPPRPTRGWSARDHFGKLVLDVRAA